MMLYVLACYMDYGSGVEPQSTGTGGSMRSIPNLLPLSGLLQGYDTKEDFTQSPKGEGGKTAKRDLGIFFAPLCLLGVFA